jgi:hypothetical protein
MSCITGFLVSILFSVCRKGRGTTARKQFQADIRIHLLYAVLGGIKAKLDFFSYWRAKTEEIGVFM